MISYLTGPFSQQDTRDAQLNAMSHTFTALASQYELTIPDDYCECSIRAMMTLKESGRSNVLYRLTRALSTPRTDGKGSKFPTDRMPMGLMEYMVAFLDFETSPQVGSLKVFHRFLDALMIIESG